jgi:serine/threonine protein kinase/phage FluMu protein Com
MLTSTSCPDFHAYRQLISGQLAADQTESLIRHLETCAVCVGRIQTLPATDRLIEWIRQAKSSSGSPEDKQLTILMQRLIQLGKPDASSSAVSVDALTFACAGCGKRLRVKEQAAGKKVKCPHCGQIVQAPPVTSPESSQTSSPGGMETVDLPSVPSAASNPGAPSGTPTLARREPSDKERELCAFLAPSQATDELGRLGSYRVLNVLGAGGMGVVFRAEDAQLQRLVALKAMLPALAANESARQRFLREARLAASLKHDRIVTIHQVGEDRGAPYLAMEFLEGESLEDRLKREGKLPLAEVLRIGREIAEGLQAAHERGLIHRDIKPANVWLEGKRGRVKILDFGLARSSGDDVHLTQSGAIVGTPAYMPPEQARGEAVDGRCDLYSLGCVLYRLSTGELPFKGENTMSLLLALAIEQPKSPRDLNPDVPPPLADLIMRLLAKDAAQRPATAGEVADALQDIADVKSPSPTAVPAPTPPRRRRRLPWAVAGGALVLAAVLTIIVIRLGKPEEGSVTIETVDPDVELVFTSGGQNYSVRDKKTGEEIQLPLGAYQVQIKGGKEGLKLVTNQFTLKRGERVLVKVTQQAVEKAVAAQAKKQPVQVLDLIELFQDTDRISVKGFTEKNQWTKAAGKLIYTSDGHSGKVMIPVSLNNVRDYEIDAQVRRLSGNNVFTFDLLTSPMRQTGLDIVIGGRIELGLEGGRRGQIGAWPKKVGDSGRIVTRVRFDTDGRHGSVSVTVEGETAAQWSGELTTIGKPIEFHPNFPGERIPGAFCFRDSFEFSSWQLRVYEGHAQILRPGAPTAPVQIPEPPPLAEWLKGRKVLTVSQDGKGQFKTIQAALEALQSHQVVKVLDRGPYRERLEVPDLRSDTGLVSEAGTVLELPAWKYGWKEGIEDYYIGHKLMNTDGFRFSGFAMHCPERKDGLVSLLYVSRPDGFLLENCRVQRASSGYEKRSVALLYNMEGHCKNPICVRECWLEGCLLISSGIANTKALVVRNFFYHSDTDAHLMIHGYGECGFEALAIRHNLFGGSSRNFDMRFAVKEWMAVDFSNNTMTSWKPSLFETFIPKGVASIRNNIHTRRGLLGLWSGAEKNPKAFRSWLVGPNCYPGEVEEAAEHIFPGSPSDILTEPQFLSLVPTDADYLRIPADSPLAKSGAGGAWPSYLGALPPGPAPKDGDWFTRLRAKWRTDEPATKK